MIKRSVSFAEDIQERERLIRSRRLGILGTGNFGRALAKRLVFSGYDVIIGSRRPSARQLSGQDECLCDIQLMSVKECLSQCDVVFVAVHVENFKDTVEPISDLFANKIVIDVSNRENISGQISNAEYLQTILPKASVVKAFNVISAYVMENDIAGGSRKVFVASDDIGSRDIVCKIARDMGFVTLDFGGLQSARKIETFVLRLFPGWKVPIFSTFALFNICCLYVTYIYFIDKKTYKWDQLFVKVLNKPICMTAIIIMALTYLPGCVAAFLQIIYGSKHRRFPKWIDLWLKSRKQLGIICFVLVFAHVLMSMILISPTYYSSWFQTTAVVVPSNLTGDLHLPFKTWMIWKGEAACLAGIAAFILLCLLAVSTLPSVGDTLNWREWRFVQSTLGYVALLFSVTHVTIMGFPGWLKKGFPETFGSITFLSVLIPMFVLLCKFMLVLPCVSRYVSKIRRGWERESNPCLTSGNNAEQCGDEYVALKNGGTQSSCGCGGGKLTMELVTPTPTCDCSV